MKLTSPAFDHGGKIPAKYTCDGENINPPLTISDVPAEARSLVLIMDDPDVPKHLRKDGMWDHWVVFNIPASLRHISEGKEPGGTHGTGTGGNLNYYGPCPPDRTVPLSGLTNYGNGSDSIAPGIGSSGSRGDSNLCNGMGTSNSIRAGGGIGARDDVCNSRKSIHGRDGSLFEIQRRSELDLPVGQWMMKLPAAQPFPPNQPELHVLAFRSIKLQPLV